jgi:sensitive to high expression protein 9, mitochondrial
MAVARRSQSQREVNDLLQRKSTWTDSDLSRFTALVRQDHLYEQEEASAKAQVAAAEAEVETMFNELMRTILNRYHEEQVWSDKIRSASTYGSLFAIGVNICVFILAILVVEPWKRRRLAETFERRIEQLSLEHREMLGKGMSELADHFVKQELVLTQLAGMSIPSSPGGSEAGDPESEPVVDPKKTDRTSRDRELWIAGTVGALGGGILTIMLGLFR